MIQTGQADSLQHCAILAHSLMSQQFGMRSPGQEGGEGGEGWGGPMALGVTSPPRGHHYLHPGHPMDQEGFQAELSPPPCTPHKVPHSPGHPVSPMTPLGYGSPLQSPQKPSSNFISNNPDYYRGAGASVATPVPHWGPELAILPVQAPGYEEYGQPPIASSLYGQDLRYHNYY